MTPGLRALLVSLLLTPNVAWATGEARFALSIGGWTHDRELQRAGALSTVTGDIEARWTEGPHVRLQAEAFGISPPGESHGRLDLRQAFFSVNLGRLALRFGRQVESWGRTDRLNPTDSLSPRDYSTLTGQETDQRLGLTFVRTDLAITSALTLSSYWIPEFRATRLVIPTPRARLGAASRWDPEQFALKLDHAGGRVDFSLSYYQGRDRIFDLALTQGDVTSRYNRLRTIGADLATTLGPYGVRLEGAYTQTDFSATRNPLARRPELWIVAGADRSVGSVNVNLQLSLRRVFDVRDLISADLQPLGRKIEALRFQQDSVQVGLTASLRRNWDDGRWSAELAGLHYFQRRQGALRLEISRRLSAHLSLRLQGQTYYGSPGSEFSTIAPTSSLGLELRYAG